MELKHRRQRLEAIHRKVLIVPFMELKQEFSDMNLDDYDVLIVPFMELKPAAPRMAHWRAERLNRTFYGIETLGFLSSLDRNGLNRTFYGIETSAAAARAKSTDVLIVPFMELKHRRQRRGQNPPMCLNRTFYGIETLCLLTFRPRSRPVLIVPFMELKPYNN